MNYSLMTENEKDIVILWKWPGEYSVYNILNGDESKKNRTGLFNPTNIKNYYSYYDGEIFVGYTNIVKKTDGVSIGVAVNPSYCNMGYGTQVLKTAVEISNNLYPGANIYLQVRTWNQRAIRCYEKAGFKIFGDAFEQITGSGKGKFFTMMYKK